MSIDPNDPVVPVPHPEAKTTTKVAETDQARGPIGEITAEAIMVAPETGNPIGVTEGEVVTSINEEEEENRKMVQTLCQ